MRPTALALLTLASIACHPSRTVHPRAAEQIRRGWDYVAAGDLERAGVAFDHALAFNPDLPEALNGAGVVERKRGRFTAARVRLEEALAIQPEFAEALVNLGELELAQERPTRAEPLFRRALALDPDLLPARLDLARTLLHRGRAEPERRDALWDAARREYLHLLESHPTLAEAHSDLAFIEHERGRFDRAAAGWRAAAAADPSDVGAQLGLCVSAARLGAFDEAAGACRRCLQLDPGQPRCLSSLAALPAAETARAATRVDRGARSASGGRR